MAFRGAAWRALVAVGLFGAWSLSVVAQAWRGVDMLVLDWAFVGQPLVLSLVSDVLGTYLWVALAGYLLLRTRRAGAPVVGGLLGALLLAQLVRSAFPFVYFQAPPAREAALTLGLFGEQGSYPSGHTARAFAGTVAVFHSRGAARVLWLGLAAITGVTRLLLGVHFVSDVVGGALLGIAAGLVARALAARFLQQQHPPTR